MLTYKLRKQQLQSIAKFDKLDRTLDASEPGTGKTAVAITVFNRRNRRTKKSALVLAPRTLLKTVWGNDLARFAPNLKWSIANAANRESAFAVKADVYITNVDAATWLRKQKPLFFKRFDTLIFDEIAKFKHHTSQRSRAVNFIKKHFPYRHGMSGTLNGNTMADVWHPALLLDDGKRLGPSFYGFRASVCEPVQKGRGEHMIEWHDKEGAEEVVFSLLADITMRHELKDIPEQIVYTLDYDLPDRQLQAYREMEATQMALLLPIKERAAAVADRLAGKPVKYTAVTAINAAAVTTKLLQIASGAVYKNADEYVLVNTGRYEMILDLVEARKHPIVYFLWKHQRDYLTELAEARGLKFTVMDGDTSDRQRAEREAGYQAGFYDVLFAHPETVAHGLTLTRGTTTIWASPTYNAEWFVQGNRRQRRIGQTDKTEVIVVLAAGTIDGKVYQKMMVKKGRMDNFNDLFAEAA